MARLIPIRLLQTTVLVMLLAVIFVSCSKDDDDDNTPAPLTIEELLTRKTWKADELRVQLSNNTTAYYKRGVSGTTYDSDSLKFTSANGGTHYYLGMANAITWNFSDAAKTKMTVVINQAPSPITIYLENIHITETYFKYSQYFTGPGTTYMASCTRVPN